jgi:MFS family permease
LLFAGRAVSSFGDRLVPVALAFAVLHLTGSASDLGIVLAAQSVPLVLFVLLGGVWADRLPRQRVMLGSDAVRLVAQGASAALILDGTAHIWQLAVLQAIYGAAEGFFVPASIGIVPQVVGADDLQGANALLGLSENATSIGGPAVAGVIVVGIGAGWGLAVDAATFLASAAFLALLRVDPKLQPAVERATSMLSELRAGWTAFSSRKWLIISVGYFTLLYAFGFSALRVLGPVVSEQALGGPGGWAAISAVLGVGALVGGLVALRWKPAYPLRAAFVITLFGGPPLLLLLAAHAPLWLILAFALLEGLAGTFFNAMWFTSMQRGVPADELSRVTSWDAVGSYVLLPVGLAVVGPIASAIGVSTTLYAAGGIFLLLTFAVLAVPSVRNFDGGSREPRLPPVP